jgi:hypothetical protein
VFGAPKSFDGVENDPTVSDVFGCGGGEEKGEGREREKDEREKRFGSNGVFDAGYCSYTIVSAVAAIVPVEPYGL